MSFKALFDFFCFSSLLLPNVTAKRGRKHIKSSFSAQIYHNYYLLVVIMMNMMIITSSPRTVTLSWLQQVYSPPLFSAGDFDP